MAHEVDRTRGPAPSRVQFALIPVHRRLVSAVVLASLVVLFGAPGRALADIVYLYDELNRLVRVILPNGQAATYHYDAVGNVLQVTRETGVPQTAVVNSASADSGDRGTTVALTITGVNLAGASVSVGAPGITLSNVRTGVDQILLDVVVGTGASPGDTAITIETATGTVTVPFRVTDSAPTIAITSPAAGATAMEATQLTLQAQAADNVRVAQVVWTVNGVAQPPLVNPPYQRIITVPLDITSLSILATATDDAGQSTTASRTVTVLPDPPPTVVITAPPAGTTAIEGTQLTAAAQATDNIQVTQFVWTINGVADTPIIDPGPYQRGVTVPTGLTLLTIQGAGTDNLGRTGTATRTVTVVPDPGTTVVGRVVFQDGQVVPGATVTVFEQFSAQSQASGAFSIPGVPTIRGPIVASGRALVGGRTFRGTSSPAAPAAGGTTNVGDLVVIAPPGPLYPGLLFAAGDGATSVATADLDGDGAVDLVVANVFSNDVSVLLSNGDGTFRGQQRYAVGASPVAVVVRDVNGDGIPDIVTANNCCPTGDVSVLLGNGDGTFQAERRVTGSTFNSPLAMAVADVNLDGVPDLVIVNSFTDTVSVLLGNGNGTFRADLAFAVGPFPVAIAVADVNGDGKPDLIVANSNENTVSVLLGNGDGTFQPEQRITVGDSPFDVKVADLNGDGRVDIITVNASSNDVSVLLSNGNGTFQPEQRFPVGNFPVALTVADFNRDNHTDIVAVTNNGFSILLGNGDGTFQPQVGIAHGGDAVTAADVDGNGTQDLILLGGSDVLVLLGRGDGTFELEQHFLTGQNPQAVVLADVNGDGRRDAIVANTNLASVSVLLGTSDGSFQPEQRFPVGTAPRALVVADLNRDGKRDVVTANATSNDVSVLLGNGDGTFQPQLRFAVGSTPQGVTVADLNGDGIPDVITANTNSGDISILFGNGDGTFQAQQRITVGNEPRSVVVADLNGDGKLDLVVANFRSNDISILLGNGDGTFQPQVRIATGEFPLAIAVADVNRDGKLDLITANGASGDFSANDVSVLLGHGDGTFQAQQRFAAGSRLSGLALADVNADGIIDIITSSSKGLSILLGNGNGTFQAQLRFAAPGGPSAVAVADVNADGKPDIVTANPSTRDISVFIHR